MDFTLEEENVIEQIEEKGDIVEEEDNLEENIEKEENLEINLVVESNESNESNEKNESNEEINLELNNDIENDENVEINEIDVKESVIEKNIEIANSGRRRISILSYNIFIRPPFVVNNFNSDHKDERINGILRTVIPNYDIICFQELFRMFSLRSSSMLKKAAELGFKSVASEAKWSQLMLIDGGVISMTKLHLVKSDVLTYSPGVNIDRIAAKGAVYVHSKVKPNNNNDEGDEEIHIHVFNTHLQAAYADNASNVKNEQVQLAQLTQLQKFIHSKIADLDPKQNVILLCGDLNVNSRFSAEDGKTHSQPYLEMMNRLAVDGYTLRDLLYEHNEEHPITVGDGHVVNDKLLPREVKLTNAKDYLCRKSLDYIILFQRPDHPHTVKIVESQVQPYFVENQPFTQLSDHYGVSTVLEF